MSLLLALADYDGKAVATLEAIRASHEVTAALLSESIELIDAPDAAVSIGATWLLRAWLEDGATLDAAQLRRIADRLEQVGAPWARLHLCQTVRSLGAPDLESAERIAVFLRDCRTSERPFLRAWATDGMCSLSQTHPRYEAEADRMLADAFSDTAASVRARARKIADL